MSETPKPAKAKAKTKPKAKAKPKAGKRAKTKPKPKTPDQPAKIGRATVYTPAIGAKLCELLTQGKTLTSICKDDKTLPDAHTVRRWALDLDHPFSPQYARAREVGYHAMVDQFVDIGDQTSEDPGAVAKARLRSDSRKWLLSKALPKIYGDKVSAEVSGPNGGPIEVATLDKLELGRWLALQLTQAAEIADTDPDMIERLTN